MKKILALLLVLALSLTLVACGSGKKDAASTGSYKVAMVTDYGDICLLYTSPSPRDRG